MAQVGNTPTPVRSSASPRLVRLRVTRFRGIRYLDWQPAQGLNVIVGPADSAKSTVLESLALVLSPSSNHLLSEFDYYNRDTAHPFVIEAVITIGDGAILGDAFPQPPQRGWRAGQLKDLPDEDGADAAIVCCVTGTSDCEAAYEVVGAGDENRFPFSKGLRQRLGLIKLGASERDRDLRLVQGSALDRFLDARALRRDVAATIAQTPIHDALGPTPAKALADIDSNFRRRHLPHPVRLGLVGTPGASLTASVGLAIGTTTDSALPLACWGSGTRRLAALELARLGMSAGSLAICDEPETGLEPYRQRAFVEELTGNGQRQAVVTTHAPAVLSTGLATGATVWRMNATGTEHSGVAGTPRDHVLSGDVVAPAHTHSSHTLQALIGAEALALVGAQSEVLVARMPVICEGVTEVGFVTALFRQRFGGDFHRRGLFCLDAGGHYKSLPICICLANLGFYIAAVVDDEGKKAGSWASLESRTAMLRWPEKHCLESAVFEALPDAHLLEIPRWAADVTGRPWKHQVADVRRNLGIEDRTQTLDKMLLAVGRERFLSGVLGAACPKPDGNSKPRGWFKSLPGGELLATQLLAVTPRPHLMNRIDRFLDLVDQATVT